MVICENWAVSPARAAAFFRSQPEVKPDGTDFRWGNCRVTLTERNGHVLDRWPIARTEVRIEGPEAEARAVYRLFYLQFLSAGG